MILVAKEAKREIVHKRYGGVYRRAGEASVLGWANCLGWGLPKERTSRTWDKVTCKNCLRSRPKKGATK